MNSKSFLIALVGCLIVTTVYAEEKNCYNIRVCVLEPICSSVKVCTPEPPPKPEPKPEPKPAPTPIP